MLVIFFFTKILTAQQNPNLECGRSHEEPVFSYEDLDLLSANGTVGGNLMDYNYQSYDTENSVNSRAAFTKPEQTRCTTTKEYLMNTEYAYPHSYPWHVALSKKGVVLCSGTLIHASWILTSGNCQMRHTTVYAGVANLLKFRDESVQVQGAVWDNGHRHPWSQLPQKRNVTNAENVTRQTSYKKLDHNLSLLKLKEPFKITPYVRPICLPSEDMVLEEGTKCATTGWGWTKMTSLLQQQMASVLPYEKCADVKDYSRSKSSQRLCVSSGCTCLENGMPFICKMGNKFEHSYVLTGVKVADGKVTTRKSGAFSFTRKKNSLCGSVPRFYLPIAPYVGWIRAVLNGEEDEWINNNPIPVDGVSISPAPKAPLPSRPERPDQLTADDKIVMQLILDVNMQKQTETGCLDRNDPMGLRYRGKKSITRHGFECVQWNKTDFSPSEYPDAGLEGNYCRNPDNDSRGPWCVFFGPLEPSRVRFGMCSIQKCP